MMNSDQAISLIIEELRKAEAKHPIWPDDKIHAAAILCEEAGELTRAAIDFTYTAGNEELKAEQWFDMEKEAAQVGAMAMRFLLNL